MYKIICGDSLEVLKRATPNSIDAIVCDPPYGLSFMGKKWDYDVPSAELWEQVLRVLKPGGHLLSFAGSRTYHRMAVNIEDAGFEIRDQIMWVYGSGFPKSHNIGKSVDKLQGNEREVGKVRSDGAGNSTSENNMYDVNHKFVATKVFTETKGSSPYEGWGTALKPAHEPIVVARKPLSEKTIAKNVLEWGTGGINIDGCRVGTDEDLSRQASSTTMFGSGNMTKNNIIDNSNKAGGRFPANFIHDGSDEVVGLFPETKTGAVKKEAKSVNSGYAFSRNMITNTKERPADSGSASRFFKTCPYEEGEGASFAYFPKASKKDRNEGLEGFEEKPSYMVENGSLTAAASNGIRYERKTVNSNSHPTVKPTALMQYLVRLVTPAGGTVLDPFAGSGSTGKACVLEGFDFIGIDLDAEYCKIAEARITQAEKDISEK